MTRPLKSKFIVVGEAPGAVEDRKGEPFVGPAGTFLKRELRRVGLRGGDGIFMNAVSCFPRLNKTPTPEEIKACKVNLFSQLEVARASNVLVCGSIALKALLPHAEITYAQGQPIHAHGKVLFPVYHPAYVLRTRVALDGWIRQLRWFAGMVEGVYSPNSIQSLTSHCMYCNQGKMTSLTCHKHESLLLKDQQKPVIKPTMVEDPLF